MLNVMVYPTCSTCKQAVKWFEEKGIVFKQRHLVDKPLDATELKEIHVKSGLPLKKFFNTSGMKYRELGLKDRLAHMTDDECYEVLASDGMLVKRPLVYHEDGRVTLGFKVDMYAEVWK
ncbi:MAG: arsenate reductase family protein [Defluviitaleaceae bacterium]|nr:arsenate reductase family protein [Defluviitaleaceae bacterium]